MGMKKMQARAVTHQLLQADCAHLNNNRPHIHASAKPTAQRRDNSEPVPRGAKTWRMQACARLWTCSERHVNDFSGLMQGGPDPSV